MKFDLNLDTDSTEELKQALEAIHKRIVEREGKKLDQLVDKSSKEKGKQEIEVSREIHLDDNSKTAQVNFLKIIRSETGTTRTPKKR